MKFMVGVKWKTWRLRSGWDETEEKIVQETSMWAVCKVAKDAAGRVRRERFEGTEGGKRLHGLAVEATLRHDEWVDSTGGVVGLIRSLLDMFSLVLTLSLVMYDKHVVVLDNVGPLPI
jgi:hypothetical protein